MEPLISRTELAAYLAVNSVDLPDNVDRLIRRASEEIWLTVKRNYNHDDMEHESAVKNATLAQLEAWITLGSDQTSVLGSPNSMKLGGFTYDGKIPQLAPRARRYLMEEGLLFRGAGMR